MRPFLIPLRRIREPKYMSGSLMKDAFSILKTWTVGRVSMQRSIPKIFRRKSFTTGFKWCIGRFIHGPPFCDDSHRRFLYLPWLPGHWTFLSGNLCLVKEPILTIINTSQKFYNWFRRNGTQINPIFHYSPPPADERRELSSISPSFPISAMPSIVLNRRIDSH